MDHSIDQGLAELVLELADSVSVDDSIDLITSFAATTLRTSHAGVTLIHGGGKTFETAGPTDPIVREADLLQNDLREGPCVDAAVEARTVTSNDLASDPRWPSWGPKAAAMGLGSILSSEMHAGGRRIGALNIYGAAGHRFDRQDMETAQLLAYHAAAALKAVDTIQGLHRALDNRTLIGQAQGILMERYDIDPDRAFSLLRRYSQNENVRLAQLAADLVAGRGLPQHPA